MATGVAASIRSWSVPTPGSRMRAQQLETLQDIVTRRIEDSSLNDIVSKDFALTSTERGIQKYEHQQLITALDTLNSYQKDRRAKSRMHLMGLRAGRRCTYNTDPRTRCVELLKRWLRTNAKAKDISESDLCGIKELCREIMNHPTLFPARNSRSFMNTIKEVHQHLDVQLKELLGQDKTCADLAQEVVCLSQNLVSDAIAFLLVGPTDLKKTDELPSLEVTSLWKSLPSASNPLSERRQDEKMQRAMKDAWGTECGRLIANLLRTRWCVQLFEGIEAQAGTPRGTPRASPRHQAASPRQVLDSSLDMSILIEDIKAVFEGTSLKNSGLAGSFRTPEQIEVRRNYVAAIKALVDLTYLIGSALIQFHRIGKGLGDYGMIRVATWLHPFLDALKDKVLQLKSLLLSLNQAIDERLIERRAGGYAVEKPTPSQEMGRRAHSALGRAVVAGRVRHDGPDGEMVESSGHVQALLKAVEELRERSGPHRLPQVQEEICDACTELDVVMSSPEFLACVGDNFPSLPRITGDALAQPIQAAQGQPAIMDVTDEIQTDRDTSLRAAAAPQRDAPEAEILVLTPSFTGRAGSGQESGDHARYIAATASPEIPKGRNQWPASPRNQWPLRVDRHESEHTWDVNRLTSPACGSGFRKHDRRGLRLKGGLLEVFEKRSTLKTDKVKTEVDVKRSVEECFLLPGNRRLSLSIRRLPSGAHTDSGVWCTKNYFFEFDSADDAIMFNDEISRLQSS